jgi:hypothetical protein
LQSHWRQLHSLRLVSVVCVVFGIITLSTIVHEGSYFPKRSNQYSLIWYGGHARINRFSGLTSQEIEQAKSFGLNIGNTSPELVGFRAKWTLPKLVWEWNMQIQQSGARYFYITYWPCSIVAFIFGTASYLWTTRVMRQWPQGKCKHCNYTSKVDSVCPECGKLPST